MFKNKKQVTGGDHSSVGYQLLMVTILISVLVIVFLIPEIEYDRQNKLNSR